MAAKWSSKTPEWVQPMVDEACASQGVPSPALVEVWTNRVDPAKWATGRYFSMYRGRAYRDERSFQHTGNRLYVVFGTDDADNRVAVLHETAHHIRAQKVGHRAGHDAGMWRIAWTLYQLFDGRDGHAIVADALVREPRYKAGAGDVAISMGIPGAIAEVAKRDAERGQWRWTGDPTYAAARKAVEVSSFKVGTVVRFRDDIRPRYMAGLTGVVVSGGSTRLRVKLDNPPAGRFASGIVLARSTAFAEV